MTPKEDVRKHVLKLRVNDEEKNILMAQAKVAGLSVSSYLRNVGQGYVVTGIVDNERVIDLLQINADLGRLGGLLKLWLTDDNKKVGFTNTEIRAVLKSIEANQKEIKKLCNKVLQTR